MRKGRHPASENQNLTKFLFRLESAPLREELRELRNGRGGEAVAISMTQRKFSMKRMALKSKFGFTKINHNYTEEERQVGKYCRQLKKINICRF